MTCQTESTGVIALPFGPILKSPPYYPERSNFSLLYVNNDPFLLPLFFSLLQIVIALEIVWPVCSSDHFLSWPRLQLHARYSQLIQAKHRAESRRAWPADKHTFFISLKSDTAQRESFAQKTAEDV